MRTAVVLFNLGGPDTLEAVKPFLFNLFYDPHILRWPNPARYLLAGALSARRAPAAREVYRQLGGASPLLKNTQAQADALSAALGPGFETVVAMRYWNPLTAQAAQHVKEMKPDRVVLLPLYPQYSTTTTQSSFTAWKKAAHAVGLRVPTIPICCYPTLPGFVEDIAEKINSLLTSGLSLTRTRFLFSAHGLPQRIVDQGDPYVAQIKQTVMAILNRLPTALESQICYQSRATPVAWTRPSTQEALSRAGLDGKDVVVIPISFVSEHAETLVELDIEYRAQAALYGIKYYQRLETSGTSPRFIQGLRDLVWRHLERPAECDRPCRSLKCGKKGIFYV